MDNNNVSENVGNGKDYFERKAKNSLNRKVISSDDIFEEQKRVVSKIDSENELYKNVVNMLENLF